MRGHDYEERAAIAEYDGGLSRGEAELLAEACVSKATAGSETWTMANKRWRAVVAKKYGQAKMKQCHEALKKKHGVESFRDLTAEQIEDSIGRMNDAE